MEQQSKLPRKNRAGATKRLLRQGATTLLTFYAGFTFGLYQGSNQSSRYLRSTAYEDVEVLPEQNNAGGKIYTAQEAEEMVQRRMDLFTKLHNKGQARAQTVARNQLQASRRKRQLQRDQQTAIFSKDTHGYTSAMSLVDRDQFAQLLDTGVPLDPSVSNNSKVILLHGKDALPNNASLSEVFYTGNAHEAVQNCNYVSVVLTQPNRPDQCIAIMGQYNSYHIQKFMRVANNKPGKKTIDPNLPLKLVPRTADTRHQYTTATPTLKQTKQYWNSTLREYFINLDTYLEDLRPILKEIELCRTVIVMVCNWGQSELLMNFVCNAKAKGFDISGVIVFATDAETAALAKGLGLAVFYNEQLFRQIPQEHAGNFGDRTYGETIISKVFCVQLVSMLGYHVLFQDVDVIWYRDPLADFFQMEKTSLEIDIYMQHDGNHEQFYAPYSGNTGFYYVRNTPRTQYFLNSLLVSGDLIVATKAHQAPFLSVLSEHASLHGLRVKILPDDDFPGGMQFQRQHKYMKDLLNIADTSAENDHPYIFHMSWCQNKVEKVQFFQQMGEFYVKDSCMNTLHGELSSSQDLSAACCSAQPITKCHYSDRPSKIPCTDSPNYIKGAKSFW